jgi:hypothetical protein
VLGGIYAVSPPALAHLPADAARVDVPGSSAASSRRRPRHAPDDRRLLIDVAKLDDFERARQELATWDDL